MARLDELAQAIADVLGGAMEPEPLPVDLMKQAPAGATIFVRAVIEACARRGAPISRVVICPTLGKDLLRQHGLPREGYEGVLIIGNETLKNRVEFFRFATFKEPGLLHVLH